MALKSTQDYISYALQTYGRNLSNSTAERANILNWMQAAEQELWIAAPWSFRKQRIAVSFVAGENILNFADASNVLELFNSTGNKVDKLPHRTYYANYGASAVAALTDATEAPKRWTFLPRDSQQITIQFWPTPITGQEAGAADVEKKAAVLTDASGSYSNFPEDMRIVVLLKALKNIARHQNQMNLEQLIDADIKTALNSLSGFDRQYMEAVV